VEQLVGLVVTLLTEKEKVAGFVGPSRHHRADMMNAQVGGCRAYGTLLQLFPFPCSGGSSCFKTPNGSTHALCQGNIYANFTLAAKKPLGAKAS